MDTTVLEEFPVVVNIVILVVFSNMRYSFEKEEDIPLTKADPQCGKILGLCLIRDYVHRRPFFQDRGGALKKSATTAVFATFVCFNILLCLTIDMRYNMHFENVVKC